MPTWKTLKSAAILVLALTLLSGCSWLGLGGDEASPEGDAPQGAAPQGSASGEFDIFEEYKRQEKAKADAEGVALEKEVKAPKVEPEKAKPETISKESTALESAKQTILARARVLKAECLDALRIQDGKTINAKLFALKALGPDAFPSLLDCLAEIDQGPKSHRDAQRQRRKLGIDTKQNLLRGEIYQYLAKSDEAIASPIVAQSFFVMLSRDPTRTQKTRVEILFKMAPRYSQNAPVLSTMTWLVKSAGSESQIAWLRHLLALPSVNNEGLSEAIDAVEVLEDQAIITRLEAFDADASSPILQQAARVTLLRTQRKKQGYLLLDAYKGGAAATAGLQKGDLIISIKGIQASGTSWVPRVKREIGLGEKAEVIVDRGGRTRRMQITPVLGRFGFDGEMITRQ